MLIETIIVGVFAFAGVTAVALAVGLLVKDLFSRKPTEEEQRRLVLAAKEPEGTVDRSFFRFVEETGLPMDSGTALLLILGCGIACMGVPIIVFDNFLYGVGGLVVGMAIPALLFLSVRWWRCRKIQRKLPETLQIVADAIRSGYTLEESCDLVVREVKGPLNAEFAHAKHQFQLGHSPVSIMRRMVRRIPLPEFRVFATAVTVHQRAGGNLSQLTERMAHVARDRQEVRGHLLAVTAGSRLSAGGMIIGSIASMILLAILEPDYVGAFVTHPLGPTLLAAAVILMVSGIVWVWHLLRENF